MPKIKPPIINCHSHIFTSDIVPPYLAKTYLPAPIYYLLPVSLATSIIGTINYKIKPFFYTNRYKRWVRFWYYLEIFFKRNLILGFGKFLLELYLAVSLFYYTASLFFNTDTSQYTGTSRYISKALEWLSNTSLFLDKYGFWFVVFFTITVLAVFKSIRNFVIYLLKQLKVLPGKHITDLFYRYVQIGIFSNYKTQYSIYKKLKHQYPENTHFVVLPMDMQYMKAGPLTRYYNNSTREFVKIRKDKTTGKRDKMVAMQQQMEGLQSIKSKKVHEDSFHPFVFAHPKRMEDKRYFDYTVDKQTGTVTLVKGCLMQIYLEEHNFSGIKIYPALGYYPFNAQLLPLWKYCIQNNLPIMTHCIKGTIFYRGKKKDEWDEHPIFTEGKLDRDNAIANHKDQQHHFDLEETYILRDDQLLHLNEVKNRDFCNNFTHPLNYLCLLEPQLLIKVVDKAIRETPDQNDHRLKNIFYDENNIFRNDLRELKICFAHFGGDDQWKRFLESDRDYYTAKLIQNPEKGIEFFKNKDGDDSPGKLAYIWKFIDWYTVICSMILQYPNVYADISYILHDDIILPLLKQTLENPLLRKKVLYGTDFYVVRNHKSDKSILAEMRAGLTEEEFDQIARYNPRDYLNLPKFKQTQ